jgi:hypothetical protein
MNYYGRPVPLTEKGTSGYINNASRVANANRHIAGKGVYVSNGPEGTVIHADNPQLPTFMRWRGDFDITGSYYPFDVIRVRHDVDYFNVANYLIPKGTTDVSGFLNDDGDGIIPIAVGLFICKKRVGPGWLDESFIETDILPQFSNLPEGYVKAGRWYATNVYYPVFPEIPKTFATQTVIHGNSITANDVFWEALPMGAYTHKACISGEQVTTFDLMAVSGSTFQTEYLPFS